MAGREILAVEVRYDGNGTVCRQHGGGRVRRFLLSLVARLLLIGPLLPASDEVVAQGPPAHDIPPGVGIVIGQVVRGADSVPVPGAAVYVMDSDAVAVTDSSGFFRLMLPEGTWTILSLAPEVSYTPSAPPGVFVALEAGVVLRADIRLDRAEFGSPMNPYVLQGLTVVARSPEERERLQEGHYIDILDSEFIRSREGAARHIGDLIRGRMLGVRVREPRPGALCIESTRRWPSLREPASACRSVGVVLDGVLMGTDVLQSIPVSHIEEVRYLSSVAAATRYGTAGTNGVLIVTTRMGGG